MDWCQTKWTKAVAVASVGATNSCSRPAEVKGTAFTYGKVRLGFSVYSGVPVQVFLKQDGRGDRESRLVLMDTNAHDSAAVSTCIYNLIFHRGVGSCAAVTIYKAIVMCICLAHCIVIIVQRG